MDKIIEEAKKVSLTSGEKSFMKGSILEHMKATPIPSRWNDSKSLQSWFVFNPLYAMPIVLFLLILAGGGTGIVAQKSLPGEALYPFKIHLNENVESMAAVSPEADTEVILMQATRRLEEVEDLSAQGNLSEAKVAEVKDNFSDKVNSINKNIIKVESKGNSKFRGEINDKFKNKISEHYKAFLEVSRKSTTTPTFKEIFKSRIEEYKEAKDDREGNEGENNENELHATTTIKVRVNSDQELEIR